MQPGNAATGGTKPDWLIRNAFQHGLTDIAPKSGFVSGVTGREERSQVAVVHCEPARLGNPRLKIASIVYEPGKSRKVPVTHPYFK